MNCVISMSWDIALASRNVRIANEKWGAEMAFKNAARSKMRFIYFEGGGDCSMREIINHLGSVFPNNTFMECKRGEFDLIIW